MVSEVSRPRPPNDAQKKMACSNKLTKDHLNLILDLGINNLIFAMDGDAGGDAGRQQFLKLVEEHLSNRPGFRIQLLLLENGHDPDSFIREHGLNAFMDLKKTSVFYWRMRQAVENHEDKSVVAEQGIGLIVNETDPLQQHAMLLQLADVTEIPYDVLNRKVQEIVSFADYQSEIEISAMAERLQMALKRNPRNAVQIIAGAQVELERFKAPKQGATTASILSVLDNVYEKYEARTEDVGLKTGFPLFDKWFGGIPAEAAFLTMPGKPNHGKTSFMVTLAVRALDYNNDAIVLFHTIDDHVALFLSRICAVKYGFPSKWFKQAGKYINEDEKSGRRSMSRNSGFGKWSRASVSCRSTSRCFRGHLLLLRRKSRNFAGRILRGRLLDSVITSIFIRRSVTAPAVTRPVCERFRWDLKPYAIPMAPV
jgi:hypothetical protein